MQLKPAFVRIRPYRGQEYAGAQPLLLLALCGLLLLLILLSLALGSVSIPLDQVLQILLGGGAEQPAWADIVLKFRLPKTLTAATAGMALGISGLLMQTYFRNPLADPFMLGISAGASLGVALVVLGSGAGGLLLLARFSVAGDLLLSGSAGIGAGLTMCLVLLVAARVRNSLTLLLLGLMLSYLIAAAVSMLLYMALPERIQAYINWTFGSFSGVTGAQLPILALFVAAGAALSITLVKPLNGLLLGEDYARSLGVRMARARLGIITATALLVSAVTAFCGPIAFIGIAVPHICRAVLGSADHRLLLPGVSLTGSCLALCAALIAELPGRQIVLPLNVVMALLGAPVVMLVILQRLRGSYA